MYPVSVITYVLNILDTFNTGVTGIILIDIISFKKLIDIIVSFMTKIFNIH